MRKLLKLLKKKSLPAFMISFLLLWTVSPALLSHQQAQAAALTEAAVRLGRMGGGVVNNTTTARILILAMPASTVTEVSVRVTYPTSSAFTVDSTAGNHLVSVADLPSTFQGTAVVAWPGIATSTLVSSGDVTFPSTTLTAGTLYGFYHTAGITNPSTGDAGTHVITITTESTGPANEDTQDVAVDTLSSATGDQVVVTATVPTIFNFDIQDTTLAFVSDLSSGSVENVSMSSGIDVDTNAGNGYAAFIRSEGTEFQLDSASSGDLITSTDIAALVTCSAGTECYVIDVAVTGSGSTVTEYDGNGTTTGGVPSATDNLYEEMANHTGPVNSDSIMITAIAAISVTTAAATDYTDTLEIVGAGNF